MSDREDDPFEDSELDGSDDEESPDGVSRARENRAVLLLIGGLLLFALLGILLLALAIYVDWV